MLLWEHAKAVFSSLLQDVATKQVNEQTRRCPLSEVFYSPIRPRKLRVQTSLIKNSSSANPPIK